MKRITYTTMSCKTAIRLVGVARNQANGFPARLLGWSFHEGDDFHPRSNLLKMAQGTPCQKKTAGLGLAKFEN